MHDVDAFCQGPSAGSRDLLCKWLKELAVKTHANSTTSGLLSTVEPGAFGGQPAGNDAHACFAGLSFLQHGLIVLAQPGFNLLAHPAREALSQISTSTCLPCAWTCSHSHKRQVHATTGGGKHAVTGKRGCRSRSFLSTASSRPPQRLALFTPTVQIRLAHPTPPHLIQVTNLPSTALC